MQSVPHPQILDAGAIEFSRIIAGKNHAPIVYFIRMGDRVKIGTTTNITERVKALSLTMAEVTHIIPGGVEVERALHAQWDAYRIYPDREWFYVRGSLTTFLRPSTRKKRARESSHQSQLTVIPGGRVDVPQSAPERELFTLADATRNGIVECTYDALRQAKTRDPEFPPPDGRKGRYDGWTAESLQRWERNRPSAEQSG